MNAKIMATMIIGCLTLVTLGMAVSVNAYGVDEGIPTTSSGNFYITTDYTNKSPILIDSDTALVTSDAVTSGSGTSSDPYIISGWSVNGSTTGYGIAIGYTTKYITIKDCEFFGARSNADMSGIYIQDAYNIRITNCTIHNNSVGISVINNKTNSNDTYNINIDNNEIHHNGIEGGGGGVEFTGIFVSDCYQVNIIENHIHNDTLHGVYTLDSTNITIANNNIEYNENWYGILLSSTTNSSINNNIIRYNCNGIRLDNSDYNDIYYNNIYNNTCKGIWVYGSENNTFYYNNVYDNNPNAIETSYSGVYKNAWYTEKVDSTIKSYGNYWGDYSGSDTDGDGVGEEPYLISDENNTKQTSDPYPLVEQYNGSLPQPPQSVGSSISDILIAFIPLIIVLLFFKIIVENFSSILPVDMKKKRG